ncbi:CvpA family protein [Rhizobacter sp. Root1221]|uniref:CvpA family protein n=1 Tax=Rhizobacter sp. Root1221 TaxID=1736433 RepID=UPI0006F2B757|nr:CvpA family protein [Rhizobacter sp. Root1221]KQV99218.1 colicin V synthesis protein [Rhizobacter sp. Root1221]
MAWLDLALLAVLLVSVVVGLVRGLVFEVMSLVGWVVAYFVAHWFSADVAALLPIGTPGSSLNTVSAFVLTFIAALLAWAIGSRIVRLIIHATPLSVIDRLLGAVFGGLRGMLVLLVIVTVVGMTPASQTPTWRASMAVPWLQAAVTGLKPMLPAPISKHLPA